MTAPKPSATFGGWRKDPVKVIGRTVIPATFSEKDRERIDSRMYSNVRDQQETTSEHDDSN